jgi:hypothetical protein
MTIMTRVSGMEIVLIVGELGHLRRHPIARQGEHRERRHGANALPRASC